MNISHFSLRVRFRVWIGQKAKKKKKKSEYDKRKLVDLCKIAYDKSYEIRDEQDGGGGSICTSPWAMWLQDRDWTERFKHACVISNNILLD